MTTSRFGADAAAQPVLSGPAHELRRRTQGKQSQSSSATASAKWFSACSPPAQLLLHGDMRAAVIRRDSRNEAVDDTLVRDVLHKRDAHNLTIILSAFSVPMP